MKQFFFSFTFLNRCSETNSGYEESHNCVNPVRCSLKNIVSIVKSFPVLFKKTESRHFLRQFLQGYSSSLEIHLWFVGSTVGAEVSSTNFPACLCFHSLILTRSTSPVQANKIVEQKWSNPAVQFRARWQLKQGKWRR